VQRWEEWKATAGTTDMKFKFLWIEADRMDTGGWKGYQSSVESGKSSYTEL